VCTITEEQFDALDALSEQDFLVNAEMGLRKVKEVTSGISYLFVSFIVLGQELPWRFKQRYLIAPNGSVKRLPSKFTKLIER